jgi:hypothetical protein
MHAQIAKVFALFDADGTGRISLRELKRVVAELGEWEPSPGREAKAAAAPQVRGNPYALRTLDVCCVAPFTSHPPPPSISAVCVL